MAERNDVTDSPVSGTGIQSIEVGTKLLRVMAEQSGPIGLSQLALAAGMHPAKAHKYLTSFIRVGLVARERNGPRYDLGPFALELGLVLLRRGDLMTLAQEAVNDLRDTLGLTASVAIWANRGVTLVRWAETPRINSPAVRLGTVLPVLITATGSVFATYLDRATAREPIERELADPMITSLPGAPRTMADVEAIIAEVRHNGFGHREGLPEPGRASLSAPVFNVNNEIVAALALVGVEDELDRSRHGRPVSALLGHAAAISRRLGATLSLPGAA